jgi:hypothetical protein
LVGQCKQWLLFADIHLFGGFFMRSFALASATALAMACVGCGDGGRAVDGASVESPIVGGEEATHAAFPATVGLGTFDGKLVCTATRVGKKAYLTAAHCLIDEATGLAKPAFAPEEFFTLFFGDKIDNTFATMSTPQVTGVAVVPARDVDLGLLFVDDPATTLADVAVAQVAGEASARVGAGQSLELQGYGCTAVTGDDGSRRLHRATAVAGGAEVFVKYLGPSSEPKNDFALPIDVAGTGGPSSCFGDSGGAAYAPSEGGRHLRVLGVASSIDAPNLAFGDPTIRFAEYARVDDGGRFRLGSWVRDSAAKGASQPLFDATLGASVALYAPVVVSDARSATVRLPLARTKGKSLGLAFEEADCELSIGAARVVKGGQSAPLVPQADGSFAVRGSLAGPFEALELDVDFPTFDEIDNESALCNLRALGPS